MYTNQLVTWRLSLCYCCILTCCVLLLSGELVTLSTVLGWSYVLSASTELGSELTETREPCLCNYIDNIDSIYKVISTHLVIGGDGSPLHQRCLSVQLVVRAQTPGEVEFILAPTRPEQVQ